MTRKLVISVDVEALPARAPSDHVNRLIWGLFGDIQGGMGAMMSIAERHNVALTAYLDFCGTHLYGDPLLAVGRIIHGRGHDVQLHAHPDYLPKEFWASHQLTPHRNLNSFDHAHAAVLTDDLCRHYQLATGQSPRSFRGGAYRYSPALLDALVQRGVTINSSLNPKAHDIQPVALPVGKQFMWSNGCKEIPVSCVENFNNHSGILDFNFNRAALPTAQHMVDFLDLFYRQRGDDAIAMLVMHSWSFLALGTNGHFGIPNTEKHYAEVERFDSFLELIKDNIQVVTPSSLLADAAAMETLFQDKVDMDVFIHPPVIETSPSPVSTIPSYPDPPLVPADDVLRHLHLCPICTTPKARFDEGDGRRCPGCWSLERQRALAVAYDGYIHDRFDIKDRIAFILGASKAEIGLLLNRGLRDYENADIRPEARPHILLDVCAMPQIATASQDFILAIHLLPFVHDYEAALRELARILSPEGWFISMEPVVTDRPGRIVYEQALLTSMYGQEVFDKYKVGRYRVLNANSYRADLEKHFMVDVVIGIDPVTEQKEYVYLCKKKPAV